MKAVLTVCSIVSSSSDSICVWGDCCRELLFCAVTSGWHTWLV